MTSPELSRRVGRILNTVTIAGERPELRRRIVAAAEDAESFEDLSVEIQAVILAAEKERDALEAARDAREDEPPTRPAGRQVHQELKSTPRIVSGMLCNGSINGTEVYQSVSYSPERGIEISGSDYGRAPTSAFGSSEYEYWRTVKPEYVGRVFYELLKQAGLPHEKMSSERLIELICTRFGGDHRAERRFRMWCEGKGIPTEFFSWVSGD